MWKIKRGKRRRGIRKSILYNRKVFFFMYLEYPIEYSSMPRKIPSQALLEWQRINQAEVKMNEEVLIHFIKEESEVRIRPRERKRIIRR